MFFAMEAFRWTKAVLGHPALFRRFAEAALIQEDETPHVGYLATALRVRENCRIDAA